MEPQKHRCNKTRDILMNYNYLKRKKGVLYDQGVYEQTVELI